MGACWDGADTDEEIIINYEVYLQSNENLCLKLDDLSQYFQTKSKLNPRIEDKTTLNYLNISQQPFQLYKDYRNLNYMPSNISSANLSCKSSSNGVYLENVILCDSYYLIYQSQIGDYLSYDLRREFRMHENSSITHADIHLDTNVRILLTCFDQQDNNRTVIRFFEIPTRKAMTDPLKVTHVIDPELAVKGGERFKLIPLLSSKNHFYVINSKLTLSYFWNGLNFTDITPYNYESSRLIRAFPMNLTIKKDTNTLVINSVFLVSENKLKTSVGVFFCSIDQKGVKCQKYTRNPIKIGIFDFVNFQTRKSLHLQTEYQGKTLKIRVYEFSTYSYFGDFKDESNNKYIFQFDYVMPDIEIGELDLRYKDNEHLRVVYSNGALSSKFLIIQDKKSGSYHFRATDFLTLSLLEREVRLFLGEKGFIMVGSFEGSFKIWKKRSLDITMPVRVSYGSSSINPEKIVNNLKVKFQLTLLILSRCKRL